MPTEPQAAAPRPLAEANTAKVDPLEAHHTVQRAVAAERERCARIAAAYAQDHPKLGQECAEIAAAIRRGE